MRNRRTRRQAAVWCRGRAEVQEFAASLISLGEGRAAGDVNLKDMVGTRR